MLFALFYSPPESHGVEVFTIGALATMPLGWCVYLAVRSRERRKLNEYHEQLRHERRDPRFTSTFDGSGLKAPSSPDAEIVDNP